MPRKSPDLEDAYALETPDDNRRLYRDWAESYDEEFAARRGYVYPRRVAETFLEHAGTDDAPVLDVGCGTGLVAEALDGRTVDGLDISREMLDRAAQKGLYRDLIEADLTADLPIGDSAYGGVVSAGTFTHGHVGPEALAELMRVARPGALCVVGINSEHYESRGFDDELAALVEGKAIGKVRRRSVRIYEDPGDEAHAEDEALIAWFRRI